MIHRNYWLYFDAILDGVVGIEKSTNASSALTGPWSSYKEGIAARRKQRFWRIMLVYGPLTLFLIADFALIVGNVVLIVERVRST